MDAEESDDILCDDLVSSRSALPQMRRLRSSKTSLDTALSGLQPISEWLAMNNIFEASYEFPSRVAGSSLFVTEYMGESTLTWGLPMKIVNLLIQHHQAILSRVHELPKMGECFETHRKAMQDDLNKLIQLYTTHLRDYRRINSADVVPFKKTVSKGDPNLTFIATNLHVQRLCATLAPFEGTPIPSISASTSAEKRLGTSAKERTRKPFSLLRRLSGEQLDSGDSKRHEDSACLRPALTENAPKFTEGCHDMVTVGIPAAHPLRFKSGGLHRIMTAANRGHARRAVLFSKCLSYFHTIQASIPTLRADLTAAVLAAKPQKAQDIVPTVISSIQDTERLQQMISPFVSELAGSAFDSGTSKKEKDVGLSVREYYDASIAPVLRKDLEESVFSDESHIRSIVAKLASFFDAWEAEFSEINRTVSFIQLKLYAECPSMVAGVGSLPHRRDCVFSQALSAVVTGIVSRIQNLATVDTAWVPMVLNQGILIVWESLLSTHGDELGMIEDLYGTIELLNHVTVEFSAGKQFKLSLSGRFPDVNVQVELPPLTAAAVPLALLGQRLSLHTCLFSQGVNENQIKADWFGDSKLQEEINTNSLIAISRYASRYIENLTWYQGGNHSKEAAEAQDSRIGHLKERLALHLEMLSSSVAARKERNINVLTNASQVCIFFDGLRIVSCKSAKDRTGMAVTLEQCCYLLNRLAMRPDHVTPALADMRTNGTRRENTRKNIGAARYAFNQVQLQVFPKLLRPPEGTYGGGPS